MKHVFRLFALMAVFLMGSVTTEASKTLTYDFMTNHPTSTIRIDQGYKEIRGSFAYWTGAWAGLFGNKIAFDATSAYPSLRGNGGLCDYHDHQKMYIMNLSAGDKVTFFFIGNNAAMQYHVSSTATMQGLTNNFDPISSGVAYTVTGAGNLCVLNKWKNNEAETVITKIVIESVNETETVDISNGMSTFCSKVPLDFSATPNLKAYVATGYDNGKFIFKEVKYVPSDTGFLIVAQSSTATSATVPVGRSTDYKENAISGNLFTGKLETTKINTPSGAQCYMFGVGDGAVGIYPVYGTFYCRAQKAYLTVTQ